MSSIISANRLTDGLVVYFDKSGSWTGDLACAQTFALKTELDSALEIANQAVRANLVVDPFPVSLKSDTPHPSPVSLRDSIRANGPTIPFGPKPAPQPA